MSSTENGAICDGDTLRERLPSKPSRPQQAESQETAKECVSEMNEVEDKTDKALNQKRTYGRTPGGVVFTVPETKDMVSTLFSPKESKKVTDIVVIASLAGLIVLFLLLPQSFRIPFFGVIFLFWRAAYNGGIGLLLYAQSNDKRLTKWAKKSGIFEDPSTGKNSQAWLYPILKRDFETQIPRDYKFEDAPLEYNTWLLFRCVVDLILMSDFVSYCLFAAACGGTPAGESFYITAARWIVGWALIFFNLWVKLDAHRVVKDFAWFWGDFFFLIDQELTFDGVFEMAPHPMYSVGYIGYYGISLMAASYKVLFISIVAHVAQFAFLAIVESPHIEKTYNPPQPRRRIPESSSEEDLSESQDFEAGHINNYPPLASTEQPSPVHNLIGFKNMDMHRVTDVSVILLQIYLFTLAFLTPPSAPYQFIFVINAIVWRVWYSLCIGFILDRQSNKKKWTRHFIKYGESTEEAWRQWKGIYHLSMTLCYVSFLAAAWKMYTLPEDWSYGLTLLRHVVGSAMVALQVWTFFSMYESLGEFGWFYGDFFFDQAPKLTYSGIYRFLNNPERIIGLAGIWGIALMCWSRSIFFLAIFSHILTLAFIQFVERPHMQKLYGESLRQDSGVSKNLKRALPKPIRAWQGNVDRILNDTMDLIEDFLDSAKPKLEARYDKIVSDLKTLFKHYPASITITRVAPNLTGLNPADYKVSIEGQQPTWRNLAERDLRSGREGERARMPPRRTSTFKTLMFEYGAPIKVKWTAPPNHSKKDWIGLYMVADNASRHITRVASQGRWIATNEGVFDNASADQGILISSKSILDGDWKNDKAEKKERCVGEMEFSGDKLWWTTGVFEFRYHHDGKHNVMAISLPFEIRIGRFDEEDVERDNTGSLRTAIEEALLPVVQNCFDHDPNVAPRKVDEAYGSLVEREGKFAKRVVYAVHQMFGIEFAPEVVQADGNVRNLAWRIETARSVLVCPYLRYVFEAG
ncbi:MAG: phosphatidylethanolamine N-methyltransferase [Bogoriella megaspora]|nr:MAG: phosphatidylethanolamine N-methyltransferase [Bogoriella megaspora]